MKDKINISNENFNVSIALYRPEIPSNTGNIGRLCVGLNISLHIVSKPSFILSAKEIRRAGLDYWEKLNLIKHENEHTFLEYCKENNKRIVPISKFGHIRYDEFNYSDNDILLFGRESTGLRESIWENDAANSVYLPMSDDIRSINVSNTAAIVSYEAFRQLCLNKNI
ncbi:tRNA (cytidine(34)-2'-O)-methyltransferase [Brachyspira pilosicoli]|uniref:Putative tRNA (cytidine(34)-2'-O)-methyltransferase n=5 Tax=Brachyspira pilosicoli TaxID=52584 RepID=D8IBC8_BRAP9|nr:tRNA (cytidine(34)-2'-O)-methyltransferase [Brachyspira pilosicoli]ADK30451.1 RNA methyltransferase [Brachyspira pilosicoli 95/1000]AFR70287.1 RNA methyltransferase [Brachyspira pilosicoli B2904]AGA65516.1 RNA methyltransferase [Brachyspira pilosicoli P43/6/78]MBW5377337.1 tRNA (cytidine(34)-2'-O)-methyltransferase [Brachyspira pilosicoli]MBW5391851.1 tRNA (cytidine(34)-2'-O)-methyltransferase [Brachyspira pilosicoli]